MIGVVVWSSKDREKAVIWCEDQASLAYLQGQSNLSNQDRWPEPGDLVELESEMVGSLRHARNVQVLSEQGCAALPELLQKASQSQPPAPHLRVVSSSAASAPQSEMRSRRRYNLRAAAR